MPTKIYIAGKITGRIEEAEIEFSNAETELKEGGYEVVNPMKLPHKHDKEWRSYMRECIKALCDCDAIYLLPNWNKSEGAVIEHGLAVDLGFFRIYKE